MLAFAAIAALLAQPTCDAGLVCSGGGFLGTAALAYGSGTPDFICGNSDELPDGGWGPASKYCVLQTRETANYSGNHGDLTIAALNPRSAGWLLGVTNPYFGGGFAVFRVEWNGDVRTWGSYFASGNGGGFVNPGSYAGVYGNSSLPGLVPDVVVGPYGEAQPSDWVFGAYTGRRYSFRTRANGNFEVGGVELSVGTNNDALYLTQHLEDGGTRQVVLPWSQP